MQGSKKDLHIRKSKSDSNRSCQTLWSSIESDRPDFTFSKNSSSKMGVCAPRYESVKCFDFSLQDQESSSTQLTSQSDPKAACSGENGPKSPKPDFTLTAQNVSHGKHERGENSMTISMGAHDFTQSFPQPDIPFPDQFVSGGISTYGPQALVMGVTPVRVPLPADLSTNEPIYVNAKQYQGILRRRQHRAKLEAQNKIVKNRKPYLHESRHKHAVKRARGSGGRFLNKKELQELNLASTSGDTHNFSVSNSFHLDGKTKEFVISRQEHNRGGTFTTSSSDVTSTSTNDDICHPPESRFYGYSSQIEESVQGVGGDYLLNYL